MGNPLLHIPVLECKTTLFGTICCSQDSPKSPVKGIPAGWLKDMEQRMAHRARGSKRWIWETVISLVQGTSIWNLNLHSSKKSLARNHTLQRRNAHLHLLITNLSGIDYERPDRARNTAKNHGAPENPSGMFIQIPRLTRVIWRIIVDDWDSNWIQLYI